MYEGHITFWKDRVWKKHTEGERDKKEVIICENRPRFDKQSSAQKKKLCTSAYTVACGLMGLMWALGWLVNEHSQKIEIGAKTWGRYKSTSKIELKEILKKEVFVTYRIKN